MAKVSRYLFIVLSAITAGLLVAVGVIAFTGPGANQPPDGSPTASLGGVPSGAIMLFATSTCPSGWTEYTAARGRYIVGVPNGGTVAETAGTALTDLENRATGEHNHGITDSGHTHTEIAVTLGAETISTWGGTWASHFGGVNTGSSVTGITVNATGTTAGTNAPYIQLRPCSKD